MHVMEDACLDSRIAEAAAAVAGVKGNGAVGGGLVLTRGDEVVVALAHGSAVVVLGLSGVPALLLQAMAGTTAPTRRWMVLASDMASMRV